MTEEELSEALAAADRAHIATARAQCAEGLAIRLAAKTGADSDAEAAQVARARTRRRGP